MKKSYKCVIFVLSLCAALVLGMGIKSLTDDFKAHTKDINTDTISITLGERHTCQIIDKISGTQWRFKAVLHRKGQEVPNELKTAGNENITITGAGRYIIVDDITGGKRYKVKL